MKKIFENAVWWSGVVMVGLVLGISLQFVRAWTEPTEAPPGGNVGAPINTGNNLQTKLGSLVLGLLATDYISNSSLPTAASGYVLTLDDPATGHVSWKPSTGGGGTHGSKECTVDCTWHSPPGVTAAWFYLVGGGGGGASSGVPGPGPYGWPGKAGKVTYTSFPVTPNTDYAVKVGGAGYMGSVGEPWAGLQGGESSVSGLSGTKTPGGVGGETKDTPPPGAGDYTFPVGYRGETNGTGYGTGGEGTDGHSDDLRGTNGTPGFVRITW